ncbi:MAG TPA: SDR family NAD(P)-dependent oxidoreductase, partial [Ktedonobacterales bacterium]|nr:SDR family NAD(P)-dependent oxidoreductase [Ktedonobacterales bacterium]
IMPNDWADVIGTNLSATLALIRTCDPLLRNAVAGRAAFVTDQRSRMPKAYWGAYGATKAGMEHLVLTWADEVRTTRLRVNLFDPGIVATRLRARAMPGEDPSTLRKSSDIAPLLAALCLPTEQRHGEVVSASPG